MRLALLADTHGNLIALDAVLEEIQDENIERIICLGDVAGLGPQPREVIDRLRRLGCPVVMGNADEFLLDPSQVELERHPDADERLRAMHDAERWCAAQLTDADRDYIRSFQPVVEIRMDEGQRLLCYHGSPRSAWEQIHSGTSQQEMIEMLGEDRPEMMAGGHTHDQFFRRLQNTIVLNPGSVGLAYEELPDGSDRNPPWAEYAVIVQESGRIRVDLRRVPLDLAEIRQALLECGMPHAERWAADWR